MARIDSADTNEGEDEPEYEFVLTNPSEEADVEAEAQEGDPEICVPVQDTMEEEEEVSPAVETSPAEPTLWQLAGRTIKKHKAGRVVLHGIRDAGKESKRVAQKVTRHTKEILGIEDQTD